MIEMLNVAAGISATAFAAWLLVAAGLMIVAVGAWALTRAGRAKVRPPIEQPPTSLKDKKGGIECPS